MSWWDPRDWWDETTDAVGMVKDSFLGVFTGVTKKAAEKSLENPAVSKVKESLQPVATVAKGTTRQILTVADFPYEVGNNWLAFTYNNPVTRYLIWKQLDTPDEFKEATASTGEQLLGIVRNTQLGETISDLLPGGETLQQGSGWFPEGENVRQINERKKELYPTLYGHTYTLGRQHASMLASAGIIEEDSVAFNIISGTIDFGWALGGDPINWFPAGATLRLGTKFELPLTVAARAGKDAKVTTTLTKQSKKILEKAAKAGKIVMDDAGLITTPSGQKIAANNWEAFKLTPNGRKYVETFINNPGRTPDEIRLKAAEIWRGSDGQVPPRTARRLASAETYDEVVEILDEGVYSGNPLNHVRIMPGIDPRPVSTRAGVTIKSNARKYRPFGELLPEATDFPLNNPTKMVNNADAVMGSLEIPTPIRNKLLGELFDAIDGVDNTTIFDWLDNFERTIVREKFKPFNYTEEELDKIASWRKRFKEDLSEFVQDEIGSSVPLPWALGTNPNGGYGPLYLNQLLQVNPTLIDPEDLKELIDRSGPLRQKLEGWRRRPIKTSTDPVTGEVLIDEVEATWLNNVMKAPNAIGDGNDWIVSRALKPNILMRPRYLLRALPEETLRVWATGLFDHPGAYMMQMMFGKASKDTYGRAIVNARQAQKAEVSILENERIIDKLNFLKSKGSTKYRGKDIDKIIKRLNDQSTKLIGVSEQYDLRVLDELPMIDDALVGSRPRKALELMSNPAAVASTAKKYYPAKVQRLRNPRLWSKAFSEQVSRRASSSDFRAVAKELLDGKTVDEITDLFENGAYKPFLDEYRTRFGNMDPGYVWDQAGIRNYVQKMVNDVEMYSMGDSTLLETFATGKFLDKQIFSRFYYKNGEVSEANKLLSDYIRTTHFNTPNAPDNIAYWPTVFDDTEEGKKIRGLYDRYLTWGWQTFYGIPSDTLSRDPLWNWARWKRVSELIPIMDPQQADQLLQNARKAEIPKTLIEDIEQLAKVAQGDLNIDEVELLSSQFATTFTNDSMFSASKRSRFGYMHRKTFLFYDAFRELGASALKLALNPRVLHKADVALDELRQNTFLGIDRDGDGKKDPFIYRDPISGQEMFSVAIPGFLMKEFNKMNVGFGNNLSGLSLVTTLYPTLGPFASWPLVKLLPNDPAFDGWKKLIAPYGIPDISDPSITQYFLPVIGNQQLQQFLSGAFDIDFITSKEEREKLNQNFLRALQITSVTNDYDPVTPGIQSPTGYASYKQWFEDAENLAKKLYMMQGIAGSVMPAAPITQWYAKSRNGSVLLGVLQERWNKINEEGEELGLDYQDKLEAFVNEMGSEAFVAFLQPVTERRIVGSNSSKEFNDWYRLNKKVADKYSEVSGYFSPQSSSLDPDVWMIQRMSGDIKYKNPEKFAESIQSAVANFVYNKRLKTYLDSIPPDQLEFKYVQTEIKNFKATLRAGIEEAYPSWDRASAATMARNERVIQIKAVREMLKEPSLSDNKVAIAAKEYLKFRDANVDFVIKNMPGINSGNWWRESEKTLVLRGELWNKGEELSEKYPEFLNLWQNVLSREFVNLDTEE